MGPRYSFTADERRNPPRDWCLPGLVATIDQVEALYGNAREGGPLLIPSPCRNSEACAESPTMMASQADAWLRANRFRSLDAPPLPIDVYSMARNLRSEFGSGTAMEKLAIAWAGINRTEMHGNDSVTEHLLGTFGTYGRQIGSRRPASTRQDPSVADIIIASEVYTEWKLRGTENDVSRGAIAYFDKVSQDAMHAKDPANNPSPMEVYNAWSSGGDWLTWVGMIPDVRPYRLMLFARRKDLRAENNVKERLRITNLGRQTLFGQNRAPRADWCAYEAL